MDADLPAVSWRHFAEVYAYFLFSQWTHQEVKTEVTGLEIGYSEEIVEECHFRDRVAIVLYGR